MDKLNKINTKRRNTLKNNKNNHICLYKNFHEENIEVPYSYPGDLWVHNNLLVERDKPLELFDEDYLKEVYLAEGMEEVLATSHSANQGYWILLPAYIIIFLYAFKGHKIKSWS